MDIEQLKRIMPGTTRAAVFIGPLLRAMDEFNIDTPAKRANFLAQVGHETGNLSLFEENLNYSAERLMVVWTKRFPTMESTIGYARNPVALASKVYANRMGNGDEKSGDGWRYRGAGALQLTGKDNHAECGQHFGIPLADVGDWLRTADGATRSAAWFYDKRGLTKIDNFDHICDLINIGRETDLIGDAIGYKDRMAIRERALAELV